MIIHAAVNLPTKGIYDFLLPAVMVAVLILCRHSWLSMMQNFYQEWVTKGWKLAAFMAAVLAITSVVGFERWPGVFIPLAFLGLAVALFIEFRERSLSRISARIKS